MMITITKHRKHKGEKILQQFSYQNNTPPPKEIPPEQTKLNRRGQGTQTYAFTLTNKNEQNMTKQQMYALTSTNKTKQQDTAPNIYPYFNKQKWTEHTKHQTYALPSTNKTTEQDKAPKHTPLPQQTKQQNRTRHQNIHPYLSKQNNRTRHPTYTLT